MMHGRGKSDSAIVAVKLANKAERSAAESVEPRARRADLDRWVPRSLQPGRPLRGCARRALPERSPSQGRPSEEGGPLGHLLIDFQERPGVWLLLALHHRARTRGDSGAGRAGRDDQLGRVQLFIGCPHGAPGDAELGGEVLPRGQAGARFEHAAFDRRSVSDLLGERRLGGAVDAQVQGLRHAHVVHYYFAFLVLFLA